ncbi:hypothetical protein AVDCRST_MAG94-2087 [uncultured Leptolyngbya sp.]|uniref:Uncharacterized protein n=1 Tax=uncultured Leptolyngbya sp. TaxID=332963 RepID=A0A6J4LQR8_9CYAN|nr:hypothetical protein AVDCRST_MAG94-2087 [uncultured Leptolyngbya sp.]
MSRDNEHPLDVSAPKLDSIYRAYLVGSLMRSLLIHCFGGKS